MFNKIKKFIKNIFTNDNTVTNIHEKKSDIDSEDKWKETVNYIHYKKRTDIRSVEFYDEYKIYQCSEESIANTASRHIELINECLPEFKSLFENGYYIGYIQNTDDDECREYGSINLKDTNSSNCNLTYKFGLLLDFCERIMYYYCDDIDYCEACIYLINPSTRDIKALIINFVVDSDVDKIKSKYGAVDHVEIGARMLGL